MALPPLTQTGELPPGVHPVTAQAYFGGSVFWLRRMAAWEGEQATVEYWQARREGGERGIVEIVREAS